MKNITGSRDWRPRLWSSLLQYLVRLSLISLLLVSAFCLFPENLPLSCLPTASQGRIVVCNHQADQGTPKVPHLQTPHDSDEVVFLNVHFDNTKRKLKNDVCSWYRYLCIQRGAPSEVPSIVIVVAEVWCSNLLPHYLQRLPTIASPIFQVIGSLCRTTAGCCATTIPTLQWQPAYWFHALGNR